MAANSIWWAAEAWESGRLRDEAHDPLEWPETGQDDGLAPARGIMLGVLLGIVLWAALLALVALVLA